MSSKNPLIPSYNPGNKKIRHDGWTPARTRVFLATLRQTGCVKDAARVIGMSTTSAYRLRRRDAVFAEAWEAALDDARRGLIAVAHERAIVGKETIIIRNGKEVERRITPDSSILALLIKRGDMSALSGGEGAGRQRIGSRTADRVITWEEWQAGVRFDDWGKKYEEKLDGAALDAKLRDMFDRAHADAHRKGQRIVNVKTGKGFDEEVCTAARRFEVVEGRVVSVSEG